MEKISERPFKSSRVALVIEVLVPVSSQDSWVQVLTNIPGREGTRTRTWLIEDAEADVRTVEDLTTYVAREVVTGLALIAGLQLVLPEV